MTVRASLGEVRGMFTRFVRAAQAAGIDTTGWTMQEGSTSAGRAWRLFGKGGRDVLGSDGFLGTTAREASISLHAMARVLELDQRPQPSPHGRPRVVRQVTGCAEDPSCRYAHPEGEHDSVAPWAPKVRS